MDITDFDSDDVLFSVHNYDKWAPEETRDEVELLLEKFPGEIYGLTEEGFEEQQYGNEHVDDFIQTRDNYGEFSRDIRDIGDSDYIVLNGGNFGVCHHDTYSIVGNQVDYDPEFVFPPRSCFGFLKSGAPELGLYTLQEIQEGSLDVEVGQGYFVQKIVEKTGFDKYDWNNCSIQKISV